MPEGIVPTVMENVRTRVKTIRNNIRLRVERIRSRFPILQGPGRS